MENNKYFYCYSKGLNYFLKSYGFRYVYKGINKNSMCKYFAYEKSKDLDIAIKNEL